MSRVLGFAAAIVLLAGCGALPPSGTAAGGVVTPSAAPPVGEEQQHEAGSVTVSAAWIVGTSSAIVAMNTHSVDLDGFDLTELARVRVDGSDWVRPTVWDAPKGGHHRSGTLTFGTLDSKVLASARVIELEIQNVAVPSHLLRWERAR